MAKKASIGHLFRDYNTQTGKLILPEYGRNIQMMVEQVKQIEDRDERNRMAQAIINVMGNMNPHLRDINDFKHKLWDHIAIIANFKLDIDAPYPLPTPENFTTKPNIVPYPETHIKYRYFGKLIEHIIKKASVMEDGETKNNLIELIANHLKKSYLTWNKEVVSDELIFKVINDLSAGKLNIKKDLRLTDTDELLKNKKTRMLRKHSMPRRKHDK